MIIKINEFIKNNPEDVNCIFQLIGNTQIKNDQLIEKEINEYIRPRNKNIPFDVSWITTFLTGFIGIYQGKIILLQKDGCIAPFCESFELLPYEYIRRGFAVMVEVKDKYLEEDLEEAVSYLEEGDLFLNSFNKYENYLQLNNIIIKHIENYKMENNKLKCMQIGYFKLDMIFEDFGIGFELGRWYNEEKNGHRIMFPDENAGIQYEKYKKELNNE